MFDAHVHLDFLSSTDVAEYVRRARGAGVVGFAIPGISADQWPVAKRLAKSIGGGALWGCGVHPEYASLGANEARDLVRFASEQQPDFVGETGLDARLETGFSKEAQEALFVAHIDLAEALRRPLVVHSVRRHARVLELIEGRDVRGMVHGFIGSPEIAAHFFSRGWMLSVGSSAKRSPKTQLALTSAPIDRILFESDEPGAQSDLPELARWLSELRGATIHSVAEQTRANAASLFRSDL